MKTTIVSVNIVKNNQIYPNPKGLKLKFRTLKEYKKVERLSKKK